MKTVGGLLSALGLVAVVNAQYYQNVSSAVVSYETYVTDVLTTYCPEPTTLTYKDKKYTVTKATTLTIYDCPCTVTKPVHTVYGPTKTYNEPPYDPTQPPVTKSKPDPEYWATTVVSEYVTYCPYATTFYHGDETYTVTEPKTVTVTKCGGKGGKGCTISYTVPPKDTKTPYDPVIPPTYPPKTVTITYSDPGKPPVTTKSIYIPPPPILCLGCYTIPVYLPPTPSGKPPVDYTTPIPVYTQVLPPPVYTAPPTTPTGPVPCNPAYGFPPVYGPPGCIPPWIVTGPPPPVYTGPPIPCEPTTEYPPVYGPPGCIPPWLYTLPPPPPPATYPPSPPVSTYEVSPPPYNTPPANPPPCDPPVGNPPVYSGPPGCTPPAVDPPKYTPPATVPIVYKPTTTSTPVLYTGAAERVNSGYGAMVLGGLAVLLV